MLLSKHSNPRDWHQVKHIQIDVNLVLYSGSIKQAFNCLDPHMHFVDFSLKSISISYISHLDQPSKLTKQQY